MRTVTIVSEDYPTVVDYTDAMDAARADPDVGEIHQVEGGRLRRVVRRDQSAPGGWAAERVVEGDQQMP